MTTAYEMAQQLISMRDDELIEVFDEIAINWPSTYAQIIDLIKDNAEWHIDEEKAA